MTTVGYGDLSPQTDLGQTFAAVIMLLGYSIIAVPTGIVTVEPARAHKSDGTTRPAQNVGLRVTTQMPSTASTAALSFSVKLPSNTVRVFPLQCSFRASILHLDLDSLKRGSDFTQFAIMHSKDFGSGTRGGDLGWFSEGAMVPTFNDAVFAKSGTGLINEIVESQFGYHIIKVTEPKTNVSYTVSKITRNVYPSEDTKDVIYTKVSEFLTNVKTTEDFTAKVEANADVQKFSSGNLTSMDQFLRGVGNARPIVRWAFNEGELNKVSNILSVDNAYIVATITSVNPKGTAPLESVREEVAIKVRNAKKASQIASKLDATKSLEDIAASYGENISVRTANALNLTSSSIDGIGFDPRAVGASFVLANGDKSSVIEGENGVLIIEMVAKTEPSPKEDYSFEKASMLSGVQSKTNGLVFQALKDLLDIEDNRVRYY